MKLFSIFKKKEKKVNPEQLIVNTFDSNYKKLLDELTLDELVNISMKIGHLGKPHVIYTIFHKIQ